MERLINYITGVHPHLALSIFILQVSLNRPAPASPPPQKKTTFTHKEMCLSCIYHEDYHLWTNANLPAETNI